MAKKEYKIDIGRVLESLDTNNVGFYNGLNEEEKKSFSAWLIMRWASSCYRAPEHYLLYVNELVNVNFNLFSKDHQEFLWKLLATCGTGKKERHIWIPPPKKHTKSVLHNELSKLYPLYKHDEIEILMKINSKDELYNLFSDHGYDKKEIKEIL